MSQTRIASEHAAEPLPTVKWVLAASQRPPHSTQPVKRNSLLEGTLAEYRDYSGRDQDLNPTVDWLLQVVSLLFARQSGRVMTHPSGPSTDWVDRNSTEDWVQVLPGQQMRGNIYEFWLDDGNLAQPAKHCRRTFTSHAGNEPIQRERSKVLKSHLEIREGNHCPITNIRGGHCVVAHLIPKRLGHIAPPVIGDIQRDYEDPAQLEAPFVDVFDDRVGIFLHRLLQSALDKFELGFLTSPGPSYTMQCFYKPDILDCDKTCHMPIHNTTITFTPPSSSSSSISDIQPPSPTAFRWHYLQCVLLRFSTPEYRDSAFAYNKHGEYENTDDYIESDCDSDDLYPGMKMKKAIEKMVAPIIERQERLKIQEWMAGVPV